MCRACGARHYNFNSCPGRRGTAKPRGFNTAASWPPPPPEDALVNGAIPWEQAKNRNVTPLPRVPQDFGPEAA